MNSIFIIDQFDYFKYFNSLKNKNLIKLSDNEIIYLKYIYTHLEEKNNLIKANDIIYLDESLYDRINKFNANQKYHTKLSLFLETTILQSDNRAKISCRKLANEYFKKTGEKIGKSTVNNVLRNDLGFRFLKTVPKSNYLQKEAGILSCLCFIKAFVKCIKLGFQPIFLDESKIELTNNHFKCWRLKSEVIYFGDSNKKKNNLILAVGCDNVFHYKIKTENINAEIFLEFLKDLYSKIKSDQNNKYVLIMDNLQCHKNIEIINFLIESKLNALFNAPYCSMFNAVELAFRSIKRKIYSKIYNSLDEVNSDIISYLSDNKIESILMSNYIETLSQYISYTEKKSNVNLNNFQIIE